MTTFITHIVGTRRSLEASPHFKKLVLLVGNISRSYCTGYFDRPDHYVPRHHQSHFKGYSSRTVHIGP